MSTRAPRPSARTISDPLLLTDRQVGDARGRVDRRPKLRRRRAGLEEPGLRARGADLPHTSVSADNVATTTDARIRAGDVHSLLGENGRRQTTLMKSPYASTGERGPVLIARAGLHQSPQTRSRSRSHAPAFMCPALTVAETTAIGQTSCSDLRRTPFERKVRADAAAFGLPVDPTRASPTCRSSAAAGQIVRALGRGARVLILDEPTAVLTPQEARELMTRCATCHARHVGRLHQPQAQGGDGDQRPHQRAARGRHVRTTTPAESSERELAMLMIGATRRRSPRSACAADRRSRGARPAGRRRPRPGRRARALLRAARGRHPRRCRRRRQWTDGAQPVASSACARHWADRSGFRRELAGCSPSQVIRAGLGFVTEDRQSSPVPDMASPTSRSRASCVAGLQPQRIPQRRPSGSPPTSRRAFDIRRRREPHGRRPVGRQQAEGRDRAGVASAPKVLIINQPTRGVDVGAAEYIRQRMLDEREKGTAILLISADPTRSSR